MAHDVDFLEPSTVERHVKVISEVHIRDTHYDLQAGSNRLCAGQDCWLCHEGCRSVERTVIRVSDEMEIHYLLMCYSRVMPVLRQVQELHSVGRTAVLSVRRSGASRNSPIDLRIHSVCQAPSLWAVDRLISACFLPPLFVDVSRDEFAPSGGLEGSEYGHSLEWA